LASGGLILNFLGATGGGAEISLGAAAPWPLWNRRCADPANCFY